jgi:hypothetical protein
MKTYVAAVALVSCLVQARPIVASEESCGSASTAGTPWTVGDAVLFRSSVLEVDADGAPNAYMVNGDGLSYTCDGVLALDGNARVTRRVDPEHWQERCRAAWAAAVKTGNYNGVAVFGFLLDKTGKPVVQGKGDPLPGKAFISTTTVSIPATPSGSQRHYVDATKVPYIVLPGSFRAKYKVADGTLAVVYRPKTGTFAYAVFGDAGRLGEASIALHHALGNNPIARKGGVDRAKIRIEDPTLTVVFPGRVAPPQGDASAWTIQINKEGAAALAAFGGNQRLAECAKAAGPR